MPRKAPVGYVIRGAGGLDAVFAEGGEEFGGVRHLVPLTGMAVAVRHEGRTAQMVAVEAAILPEEKAVVIRLRVAGDDGLSPGAVGLAIYRFPQDLTSTNTAVWQVSQLK